MVGIDRQQLDRELMAWKHRFGAGMLPFDAAYSEARYIEQKTDIDAQRAGAHALLGAFVNHLKDVMGETP